MNMEFQDSIDDENFKVSQELQWISLIYVTSVKWKVERERALSL